MFVPLGDQNPIKRIRFQYVTVSLIAVNVLAYLLEAAGGVQDAAIASFAVVPSEFFQVIGVGGAAPDSSNAFAIPERATLLTYMFLHADPIHLLGNMLFLWVFGDNVEDAMGHVRFLVFYLVCGVLAGLTHALMMPDSSDALIGASGAVSGVIAAYLMLHPHVRVWVLAFKFIPLNITAAWALGLWILFQLAMVLIPQVGPTAWWAHIGGLAAGALLLPLMKSPKVPLFGR
ncbi:MAG: rhomboid family intramembrane serine protease [Hyphomicrobiaceae bacterium]|nr:rhomboid family intramembrane serine protease [Hyphomicrobiaceae bacterium]